jgi:hypothetical protein
MQILKHGHIRNRDEAQMSSTKTPGASQLVIAIGLGLYTYAHRPVEGLMDAMQRADSWAFKPSLYYLLLFISALFALSGILQLTKGKGANSSLKPCPFCAELIQPSALKCRFCNSELPQDFTTQESTHNEHKDEPPGWHWRE